MDDRDIPQLCKELQQYSAEIQLTTGSFHEIFRYLLEAKGYSEKELCKKCLLDQPRLTAVKQLDDDTGSTKNVTLQVLVTLFIGMGLSITVSEYLLGLRGYALSKRNPVHLAYRYLIEKHPGIPIEDANKLLTELFKGTHTSLNRILLGSRGYWPDNDQTGKKK